MRRQPELGEAVDWVRGIFTIDDPNTTTMLMFLAAVGGIGLGVPVAFWLLRRTSPSRRATISVAVYLAVEVASRVLPGANPAALDVARFILGVNAGLQLMELVVWETILRGRLGIELPRLLVEVINFVALAGAAIYIILKAGDRNLEVTDVLVTSTVVSAVIGLALQEVLGNVMAGVALHAEGPFGVGDWVTISSQEGQIVQMGWRTTTLRTRDNHFVTVPNGQVARELMINYAKPTTLQAVNVHVGVSYRDPPARVKATLIDAALDVEAVSRVPTPVAYTEGYQDFAVAYRLKFWITDYGAKPEIMDAVMTRVWYQLRRRGMTIPFPIRDVNFRRAPGESERLRESESQVASALETLERIPLVAPLAPKQREEVARGARLAWFAPGEAIVRQGDSGDSLFVVRSGKVQVLVESRGTSQPVQVAERGPGSFFGEMSLLTGEPRNATVRAMEETEVVVVDKAAVAGLMMADPEVAELLSSALAERAASRAQSLEEAEARTQQTPKDLLARIRQFFAAIEEG